MASWQRGTILIARTPGGEHRSRGQGGGSDVPVGRPRLCSTPVGTGAQGMGALPIVVANEPRAYRQVIAAAFRQLRPHLRVIMVEPEELDSYVGREGALLVVCSRASEAVQARAGAWILLYPDGKNRATISIADQQVAVAGIQFADLLGVLD